MDQFRSVLPYLEPWARREGLGGEVYQVRSILEGADDVDAKGLPLGVDGLRRNQRGITVPVHDELYGALPIDIASTYVDTLQFSRPWR